MKYGKITNRKTHQIEPYCGINGCYYKDYDAWDNKKGIVYIPDNAIDCYDKCYYGDHYTYEDFIKVVKEYVDKYNIDINVEKFAYEVFEELDWQYPETFLEELLND